MKNQTHAFVCPECGSTEARSHLCVSTNFDPEDVWSGVLGRIVCARCHFVIPEHLGERKHDSTLEDAQQQWQRQYRPTAWKSSPDDEGDEGDEGDEDE